MRQAAATRRQRGFTLLEMLVALAVLGLLLGLLAGGVHLGLRAWQAQARVLGAEGYLDATDRVLRTLVTQMDPGSARVPPILLGSRNRLLFTAPLPDGAAPVASPLANILLTAEAGHGLVLRWIPYRHEPHFGPPPVPQEVQLLPGVQGLDLAYWPRTAPWVWHRAWAGPGLPGLVRIRLRFAPDAPEHWPEIVVAPMRDPRSP